MSNKKSDFSKKIEKELWIWRGIDLLILVVPLLIYFGIGLANKNTMVVQKVALVGSSAVALILTIFNIIFKRTYRSALWIMIIGIYIACDNLIPLICSIAVATIIDEFMITPHINRLHTKYLASVTIDEREAFQQ